MHITKSRYRAGATTAFLLLVWLTLFSVRETEFALITQFGKPVRTITSAGLNAKWFFQSVTYFDRRLRVYDPRPSEFLTRDKKNLVIESYVAWRIGEGDAASTRTYSEAYSRNPKFYKLVRTLESYKKILDDKTTAILSSDSELLRVLMKGEGGVQ